MRKALVVLGLVLLGFFTFRACGKSPEESARAVVQDFVENIREGEGKKAVKLLYPPLRDALSQDLKLPLQLTEMTPSQTLACLLSSMGENIKRVKVVDTSRIDDKHVEVLLKVMDKQGKEKFFTFIVIKEDKNWRIASISGSR
ncbi:MAG: DUF4878 domain-containing protein [Aquificaceae bacterium]|nr:DUF4878 domain-containing protein [Aquificaceae bacterium]MCX8059792.1 DUF4878 domain-containing protein [Aquificaceae bacterium]